MVDHDAFYSLVTAVGTYAGCSVLLPKLEPRGNGHMLVIMLMMTLYLYLPSLVGIGPAGCVSNQLASQVTTKSLRNP